MSAARAPRGIPKKLASRRRNGIAASASVGARVFGPTRYYAIVVTADGPDLNELLVSNGLARIYGTRTPLPDGRDSRTYLAHLHELENEARVAKRGAWGKCVNNESVHFVVAVWRAKEADSGA